MSTLILDRLWINRLDTGEAVAAKSWDRSPSYDMDGEVRSYAGGRQRSISTEGERGSVSFTLRKLPLATVELLRSWMGLAVQVRDDRGQCWVGVFFQVRPDEPLTAPGAPSSYWWDVALTVRTVTAPEET
ncbi:hypothetical protein [Micromonospora aurantiaca (nom. illeg.)]|uniref:hypothetical protein n=1 Tax=Micromonospora aurantiaca (nom. illeg.) TaxID=47850 RepID=UPI003EBE2A10